MPLVSSIRITQSTFDETVLENQEVFELSPYEATVETISQFKQQGIDNLENFVSTSHPDSAYGRYERDLRSRFEEWIHNLNQCVRSDGSVNFDSVDSIVQALIGVRKFCAGRLPDFEEGPCGEKSSLVQTIDRQIPFLWLFQSSGTLFTLVSLMSGALDIQALFYASDHDKGHIVKSPDEYRQRVLKETLLTLISVVSIHYDSERDMKISFRDQFAAFDCLITLISYYDSLTQNLPCDSSASQRLSYTRLLTDLVALSSLLCRNIERNKVAFVRARPISSSFQTFNVKSGGIQILTRALRSTFASLMTLLNEPQNEHHDLDTFRKEFIRQISEMCSLVSVLCRFDDFRSNAPGKMDSSYGANMSSVHDHVLEFFHDGAVPVLCDIAQFALLQTELDSQMYQQEFLRLTASILTTARVLAVNDDVVQALVAMGSLKIVQKGLDVGIQSKSIQNKDVDCLDGKDYLIQITAATLGLIRNLSGNDEIKTTLCLGTAGHPSSSVLASMLEAMSLYRSIPSIQEHCCGAMAAMALRKPANALRIVEQGGPNQILTAMRQHPQEILVQRQGALAIRNIISRLQRKETSTSLDSTTVDDLQVLDSKSGINVRETFLDLGAEKVLREITALHQGSIDEAYAALRDLGCQVSMLTYDAENNVMVNRTMMFGEMKPQFRPTYDH